MRERAWLFVTFMVLLGLCLPASGRAPIEVSFELPQVQGNPFDFTANDVKVTFAGPGGAVVTVPAFFDGGTTWRARHTPAAAGRYVIRGVTLNGAEVQPGGLSAREFDVAEAPRPGFVRVDPRDKMRFAFDDGTPYYPVGYDLAWRQMGTPPMPPLVESLKRMGRAGVNWTRIWMDHWDGKNLDWFEDPTQQPPLGKLSLTAAKLWDDIVATADENHVHFQLVLQHHGQYSTHADANWAINPWNKANGGWLEKPEQFFTDPRAIAMTKNKYRYIVARWGYSPAIMAWELFNEVEYTDAYEHDLPAVAAWHAEMAKFLREQDAYHHLITTSSRLTGPSIWTATDYYQAHVYPPDMLSAIDALDYEHLDRPYFYGECGGGDSDGGTADAAETIHRALWASLMSGSSGTAQYWFWYIVEPEHLDTQFTSVQKFIRESRLLEHANLHPLEADVQTPRRVALHFGPGSGWAPAKATRFVVKSSGAVENLGGMSAYLQGDGKNRAMFPFAEFEVDYPSAGTFTVRADEATADGASVDCSVDGHLVATLGVGPATRPAVWRASTRPTSRATSGPSVKVATRPPAKVAAAKPRPNLHVDTELRIPVPPGRHVVRLENLGTDWIHLREFELDPYAPQLAVRGKGDADFATLWLRRRAVTGDAGEDDAPVTGTIALPGMAVGSYRVYWWDPSTAAVFHVEAADVPSPGDPLTLTTPPIAHDAAVWLERTGAR